MNNNVKIDKNLLSLFYRLGLLSSSVTELYVTRELHYDIVICYDNIECCKKNPVLFEKNPHININVYYNHMAELVDKAIKKKTTRYPYEKWPSSKEYITRESFIDTYMQNDEDFDEFVKKHSFGDLKRFDKKYMYDNILNDMRMYTMFMNKVFFGFDNISTFMVYTDYLKKS